MTPQERQLVADLFERLAELENEPRDPDAERVIRDGLAKAPHAIYPLVQSVLVQDEALKQADAHIQELEAALQQGNAGGGQQRGFLDNMRDTMFGAREAPRGSVPSVRPGEQPMGVPPQYRRRVDRPGAAPRRVPGADRRVPHGAAAAPMAQQAGGGGGSFLGTAAAVAAGAIGGGLLLERHPRHARGRPAGGTLLRCIRRDRARAGHAAARAAAISPARPASTTSAAARAAPACSTAAMRIAVPSAPACSTRPRTMPNTTRRSTRTTWTTRGHGLTQISNQ